MTHHSWPAIVERAAGIVRGYDTGVTLRQLFYRLVSDGTLRNTQSEYSSLSSHTAEARRAGTFPDLIDRGRSIHRFRSFDGPEAARKWLADIYRRDRTEGQRQSVYLGVEKAGIVEQLSAWFGDFGLPILALGGYASQTYIDEIVADARETGRRTVLVYAGDFDASGEDIDRDLTGRCACFDEIIRVALSEAQVAEYGLPENAGKTTDTRARGFVERHGRLVQVELDALPPDVLRGLFSEAVGRFLDVSAFDAVVEREQAERAELAEAVA
jgi:hypothetical protein